MIVYLLCAAVKIRRPTFQLSILCSLLLLFFTAEKFKSHFNLILTVAILNSGSVLPRIYCVLTIFFCLLLQNVGIFAVWHI